MGVQSVIEQLLNGVQLGIMLFLVSAGLTLVFGIMNLVNMAHGSLYMVGAYAATTVYGWSGSYLLALVLALAFVMLVSIALEFLALRRLYARSHLDQVLGTFGVILFFNEIVRLLWGPTPLYATIPAFLDWRVELVSGFEYPAYRLAIIVAGLTVALSLYLLIAHTRIGMLIRAGASDRTMIGALGVNIRLLFTLVFGLGGVLAGFAGLMAGPIYTVAPGMGEEILILSFVVIVIGGIGSVRGAFVAALAIGLVDTMGRAFLRDILGMFLPPAFADSAAPGIASMLIYIMMAVVLAVRPQGLFSARA